MSVTPWSEVYPILVASCTTVEGRVLFDHVLLDPIEVIELTIVEGGEHHAPPHLG